MNARRGDLWLYLFLGLVLLASLTTMHDFRVAKHSGDSSRTIKSQDKIAGLRPKIDDVEAAVQERLHYDEA